MKSPSRTAWFEIGRWIAVLLGVASWVAMLAQNPTPQPKAGDVPFLLWGMAMALVFVYFTMRKERGR